jgi:hypothetical protein
MTQLNDKERAAQMADMKSFDEEMPSIGIFWYDPNDHTLFGVGKKELTPQMVEEARAKGVDVINYPTFHNTHYTQVPRGRVAWNIDKFIVLVGHWAEPVQEELAQLVEDTFHLPYFEFVYDEHWDLGHGWSGDMPGTR